MEKTEQKQTGCCLGTLCLITLIIIVVLLVFGLLMGVLNCF